MNKQLGLFGGTFNPIHTGHLNIASDIQKALELDEVFFVPAASPPHKSYKNIVDISHRLKMLELALSGFDRFRLSDIEVKRPGKSYTIETLKTFKAEYPDAELFFIIGADNLKEIKYWNDPEGILELSNLVVINRPGYKEVLKHHISFFNFLSSEKLLKKIKIVKVKDQDISSTKIRENIYNNISVEKLLNKKVQKYIMENNLYKDKKYL